MHEGLDKKHEIIQKSGILRSPKRIYKNKILQNKLGIKSLKVLKQYDNIITALISQFNNNWEIFIDNNNQLSIVIYYPTMEIYTPKHNLRKTIKDVYISIGITFCEETIQLLPLQLFRGCCDIYEYDKGFLYSHSPRNSNQNFEDFYFNKRRICLGHSEIESSLSELNINETFELEELKIFFFYLDTILPIEDTDGSYYSIDSLKEIVLNNSSERFYPSFNACKNLTLNIKPFIEYIKSKDKKITDYLDITIEKNNLIIREKDCFEDFLIEYLVEKDLKGLYFIEDGSKMSYSKKTVIKTLYSYQEDFKKGFKNSFTFNNRFIYFRGEKVRPKIQTYNIQKDDMVKESFYLSFEWKVAYINNLKNYIFNEYYRKQHQNFRTQIFQ